MSLSLGSYPDFLPVFFPFGLFLGRFISVASGSSALLVFSFLPVSYLMYFYGYRSFTPAPILNIFGFYVCLG